MSEEREQDETSRKSRSIVIWLWFPMLYVLSIGPAGVVYDSIANDYPSIAHGLELFYLPLDFLCDRIPWVHSAIDQYLDLWSYPFRGI